MQQASSSPSANSPRDGISASAGAVCAALNPNLENLWMHEATDRPPVTLKGVNVFFIFFISWFFYFAV